MKNGLCIILTVCCLIILFSGCQPKYQRISFDSDTLSDEFANRIHTNTVVINSIDEAFPTQLPIYEIKERTISEEDLQKMLTALGLAGDTSSWIHFSYENNRVDALISGSDYRPFFDDLNMTEEELESLAWSVFNKIPFMEGEYEYLGITSTASEWTQNTGERRVKVGVSFQRLIDGMRAIGSNRCDLYFDGCGLVEFHIAVYDYSKIGTTDVVEFANAAASVKAPDHFSVEKETGIINTLQVDRVKCCG